jgi:DNA-binding GntR family transcriptional regulator
MPIKTKTKKTEAADRASPANETQATTLYRALKGDIIRGSLAPRQWLRIDFLRKRYGAGATPLREALNRLSTEGFVEQKDQRGFAVTDVNESDLDELIFTRCALNEVMLPNVIKNGDKAWEERVVLAHYHLSKTPPFGSDGSMNESYLVRHREFHLSLLAPCGSRWLLELSEKLFDLTQRYQHLALRQDVVGSRDVASEHQEMVKAILSRDLRKSIRLLNEHVRTTGRFARVSAESTIAV